MNNKVYLADSVYVESFLDTNTLKIYTDNGMGPNNEIILEPDTLIYFLRYVEKVFPHIKIKLEEQSKYNIQQKEIPETKCPNCHHPFNGNKCSFCGYCLSCGG